MFILKNLKITSLKLSSVLSQKHSSIQNLIIRATYTVFVGYINMRFMSFELAAEEE
jgi:hypothetical protein